MNKVFMKIERSGLSYAAEGNVLISVHKEQELVDVAQRYPARQYVLADTRCVSPPP